jgi:6-phosphogluconolactonase
LHRPIDSLPLETLTMTASFWKKPLTRRGFQAAWPVLAMSASLLGGCASTAPESGQTNPVGLVYVGMDGAQMHALRFDASAGTLTKIGPVADVPKPRWAVAHPQLPMLYAATDGNGKDGSVVAFSVNRETGALTKVSEVAAGGAGTTHLWLDAPSMTLFAANFGGGTTSSFAVDRDGSLGALVSTIKSIGSGPHRRQTSPHAHGAEVDPSGHYVLVSDLGADRVFVYGFDRATHVLFPDNTTQPRSFAVPAGSGPHHTAFGLGGRFVYLLNELTADITTLRWDAAQGRLSLVQSLPISSPEFQGAKSGSEVVVSPDGRFVYVSNRGENMLVVYRVNPDSGALSQIQRTSSGGEVPWSMAIHSSGKWLVVANQRSNKVNLFRIDPASGMVSDTGQSVDSPTPVSVTFVK